MAEIPFTLDQLRILKAIVDEGSFKKAADSLFVTQPAVSLQVQNLEKQLDIAIFDRGGRKAQEGDSQEVPGKGEDGEIQRNDFIRRFRRRR